jgi:hypothetical protein
VRVLAAVASAVSEVNAGQWDDAIAELEASIKLAEETGETYSLVYAHGLLSRISLYRNDLNRARDAAAAADRNLAGWGSGHSLTWVAWPRALILEASGEPGQALTTMAGLWDWCQLRARAGTPGYRSRSCPASAGRGGSGASQAGVGSGRRGCLWQRRGLDDGRGAALPRPD